MTVYNYTLWQTERAPPTGLGTTAWQDAEREQHAQNRPITCFGTSRQTTHAAQEYRDIYGSRTHGP